MSQRLTTRYKKNGTSKGVAIRKNRSTTPSVLKSLFQIAYQSHSRKNGKSKNKHS